VKKSLAIFLAVFLSAPVWAQEKVRIAFVDMQRALNESQAGRKGREKLQAQLKKVEAEFLKEEQEVMRLKSDLDKRGPLLREEERRNLEKEFQRKYLAYQRNMRDSQEELRHREGEMAAEIIKELQKTVAEVGRSEKLTLILERSQVIYSDQGLDITDKVIEIYNKRYSEKAAKGK